VSPLNRAYLEDLQNDPEEDRIARLDKEQELSTVEDQLRLYNSSLFEPFREMMKKEENLAIAEMLNGPDESVLAKREKLRTLRHLQSHEKTLREARARLVRELEEESNE
jgi:hypothetical protein